MQNETNNAPMGPEAPMEAQRPPSSEGQGPAPTVAQGLNPELQQQMSPEEKQQMDMVNSALTEMVYNPETKASIQEMIQAAPPELAIPQTVNAVFQKFEQMGTRKNGPMPLPLKLTGGVHLFSEVMELSETMGLIPEDLDNEMVRDLLRGTMEMYIQKGLKDKSIDPIELQQEIEPLLSDDERDVGLDMGRAVGTPEKLTPEAATSALIQKERQPLEDKNLMLQQQNQQMTQALQGVANAPKPEGEGQPQGGM